MNGTVRKIPTNDLAIWFQSLFLDVLYESDYFSISPADRDRPSINV
jgi:hypothetical protein